MPFCHIFLVISMMSFLRDFHVSSCEETCTDKPVFTPSRLVVRFGDPTFASCSVCKHDCINSLYELESPVGNKTKNGTTISWTVNRLTQWHTSPICYYYNNKTNYQCCTTLPVTVYQPPSNVSISFVDPTGPMFEGQQYTLQCTVEDVAPVENLIVTFYRGRTVLSQQQSNYPNYPQMYPVIDIFSLNITLSKEDDGVQYWCEAKLELGPDGPQLPPVMTSQNITTTVYYGPQVVKFPHLGPNIVVKGDPLELSCLAVGNPSPSYTWMLPPESTSTSNSSILTINSATLADEGKYICFVSNSVGTVTVEFNVDVQEESCADKPVFTPSRLVVRFGDPTFASCSVCQHDCINNLYSLEISVGDKTTNGTTISWTVNRLTQWHTSAICYYNNNKMNYQCCTTLPVTVYQPPRNVSISFVDPTGPMFEGQQNTLQCTVEDVAPVENLTVTFYRGRTVLSQQQSNISDTNKKPLTDIFSLNITLSKEDDGVQYWCEAKLELGPDGPQLPPVMTSQNITTTVYYKPQLEGSLHPDPITVTEGKPLQLSCSTVGNPSPSYTWTLPSESTSTSNSSNITINSATLADEGNYICSVSNSVGTVTVEFNVDVQELPATNYTGIIIGLIVGVVIVILGLVGYSYCYKHNRMGQYNLKDVLRPHRWHAAVPTAE
ncbi:vascular cell adhesion protein 1-like [Anarhichas minor]|uniref:vascular cell adhesion protein 1-like n=1 Tax=Anarhichas minor TaxID=65739 RepID=UPI003F7374C9